MILHFKIALTGSFLAVLASIATADDQPTLETIMPKGAKLVLQEDWSSGKVDPNKWYILRKRWGKGNHGVVPQNVFIEKDEVNGASKNVLICRGHGDLYEGPIKGWEGNTTRVGGTIVSKDFFASGRFEVVMKIGSPQVPRPIGMVPAIWTYASQGVKAGENGVDHFDQKKPLYNPQMKRGYLSEIDFPEFGKGQDLESGLYNTFLNTEHDTQTLSTKAAIDDQYHTFTSVWRTHLVPLDHIADDQVAKSGDFWWVQDKSIPFPSYLGNPLKRLGKDQYAVYSGKEVTHFIDGKFIGTFTTYVPVMAAQLNMGVWFPNWGGKAPWTASTISIASVKVWQFHDPGDVRGVLTKDISNNMDVSGRPGRQ